ncbi:MAG: tRNA (guanosine(37)-N1)-methyltransferase TrmD [Lachnospiraceae bacterium]|jgi:tRNA (guanine37-N1)-methyltransferase|nr:tRNA (guanosine(37)-N1)-methyltransferase TrmD [Lachnospiraceae bacterium]MEE1162507.1 tRNA (guanosine(37)-N1)-methyltransferase TrmD [Lachnospiraceae bacterium]
MHFHVLTLFPEMVESALGESILGRAAQKGLVEISAVDIRSYTKNRHNRVDDYTYGGGAGMLMQAQPVYDCCADVQAQVLSRQGRPAKVLYMSPLGRTFDQQMAQELAAEEELILLCGHYEGIDARALEEIGVQEVSIGDFVLTGGELPAMMIIDAVSRMIPGVLGNTESADTDSFMNGLLEYPQYSRPAVWHGKEVPSVLLSGDHARVEEWRFEQSLSITKERRPDLYEKYVRDNPEIMAARQKRIDRQKRLEERRRKREQKRLQADTVPESRIEKQKS